MVYYSELNHQLSHSVSVIQTFNVSSLTLGLHMVSTSMQYKAAAHDGVLTSLIRH